MNEEEFREQLMKKLDELGKKIDALIQVVAITSRKESMLKGKSKIDQIKLLSDFVKENPFYSPVTYTISAIIETVFVLAKNVYPVPMDSVKDYFVT